ncbi:UNVERIFIED_CONTAM: hypothetical protein FKN15_009742 [Acipenser sinensis]
MWYHLTDGLNTVNKEVCIAVWKNHHMRTVTNYFIVNLSLADVLVTITCLPASLVVDITETWFLGQTLCKVLPYLQIPGTSSVVQRKWTPLQCSTQSSGPETIKIKTNAGAAEIKQIQARRKTARMLVVVLFVFALCYLPISILNILKRVFGTFNHTNDRETVYAWFTFSHWLVYANSAANPIIYNFLSGKFREEFKAAFSCCCFGRNQQREEHQRRGQASTDSRKSLTTQISNFDNISKTSEHVILTSITTYRTNNDEENINW